jgi:hypothetical protein
MAWLGWAWLGVAGRGWARHGEARLGKARVGWLWDFEGRLVEVRAVNDQDVPGAYPVNIQVLTKGGSLCSEVGTVSFTAYSKRRLRFHGVAWHG